ncbi:MAG: hypothetical protein K2X82_01455 [Gemmataceae bacterium]|nr:hypothetical protein [Gemmataceae bacterium]
MGADGLAGDLNADGTPDLAVGTGPGDPAEVRVFSGATGSALLDFAPFGAEATGGVRVALAYVSDDQYSDVVVGTGPGPAATVRVFDGATGLQLPPPQGEYQPFGPSFAGGVWVAASNDPVVPTFLSFSPQVDPVVFGQTMAWRVGLAKATHLPTPTGKVTFYDATTNTKLGEVPPAAGADGNAYAGIATTVLSRNASGKLGLRWEYGGDANYYGNIATGFVTSGPTLWPVPRDCGCGG